MYPYLRAYVYVDTHAYMRLNVFLFVRRSATESRADNKGCHVQAALMYVLVCVLICMYIRTGEAQRKVGQITRDAMYKLPHVLAALKSESVRRSSCVYIYIYIYR